MYRQAGAVQCLSMDVERKILNSHTSHTAQTRNKFQMKSVGTQDKAIPIFLKHRKSSATKTRSPSTTPTLTQPPRPTPRFSRSQFFFALPIGFYRLLSRAWREFLD